MVYGRRGTKSVFDIDTMCADDTLAPECGAIDSPRTLDYTQTNQSINTSFREVEMEGADSMSMTLRDSMTMQTIETNTVRTAPSVMIPNLETSWTLDQNWTLEEVNKVLGKNHHYRPAFEAQLAGSLGDAHALQQQEQLDRPAKINVAAYNPANTWWRSSIAAWFPARNFEILAVLIIYNLWITLFTGLSNVCGNADLYSPARFCDDTRWVFANADFLTILGLGMILLLALRIHMAMSRHYDIRRQWTKLESACRNLTRIICFHASDNVSDKEGWERRRAVAFIKAFPVTLKLQLRGQAYAIPDLGNVLVHQDILNLMRARNMPQFCIDNVSYYLVERVSNASSQNNTASNCLAAAETSGMAPMVEAMGSLETARKQPLAMTYALHIRFAIVVFLVLYPLHMVVHHGYITILFAFFLDYIVLGLESVATEYESTFGYARNDMDLDAFCDDLSADLEEILVRVEHESRDMIFDTWETTRKNEEMIYKASSGELEMLTAMQRKGKQGRAQFVRGATKGLYKQQPDAGGSTSVSADDSLMSAV